MKAKIVLPVVFIAVILVIPTLVVNHYNKTKTKEQRESAAVSKLLDSRISELSAQNAELKGHANFNRIECEKGQAAYELLTPINKNKTPRPECGAVLP